MSIIIKINARQILDSRGNPTIEVDVILKKGLFEKANKQHFINTEINSLNIEL